MFNTLYSQIGGLVMVGVCGFALWLGDETERTGAGAYLLGWLATLIFQDDAGLRIWQPVMIGIDLVVLTVFVALAWRSRKVWPAWAAAFQLLSLLSQLIPFVDARLPTWSFLTVVNIASYGVLIALGVGTFWAWQERRALEVR